MYNMYARTHRHERDLEHSRVHIPTTRAPRSAHTRLPFHYAYTKLRKCAVHICTRTHTYARSRAYIYIYIHSLTARVPQSTHTRMPSLRSYHILRMCACTPVFTRRRTSSLKANCICVNPRCAYSRQHAHTYGIITYKP